MKKRLLMLLALLAMTFAVGAQTVVFSEDFNSADSTLPEGWLTYGDGVANASAFDNYPPLANVGDSWGTVPSEGAVGSISWLSTDENADRWLLTPAITIPDDGETYYLSFRSYGYASDYTESWTIKLSPSGDTAKDNFYVELASIPSMEMGWSNHLYELSSYAGQTIRIAFVNNGIGYFGFLDDVEVRTAEPCGINLLAFSADPYVPMSGTCTFTYTIQNTGADILNEFRAIIYDGAGSPNEFDIEGLNVYPYENYTGTIDMMLPYSPGLYDFSMRASVVNYLTSDTLYSDLLWASTKVYDPALTVSRTVLVEDFETTPTVYTPQAEQRLAEGLANYESNVVHITHHAGYMQDSDPMTSGISQSMLELFGSNGAWDPAIAIDRTQSNVTGNEENGVVGNIGQSSEVANQIQAAMNKPAFASVSIAYFTYNSTTRQLNVGVAAEAPDASLVDALLNLYIVEDSIVSPQQDYMNGTDTNYVHNNVVRGVITDTWGNWYDFNTTYTDYSYILAEDWDASHCRVVAFLTNNGTDVLSRYVLNATQSGYITDATQPVEVHDVTATIENPQGGYIYYRVYGTDGNQVSYGRAMQGTTEVAFTSAQTLCVEYADINPMRQQSVIITPGTEYLDTARVNGEPYVFGSDEINDSWDEYGYRIYSVCGTYDSNVTFTASYLPYIITEEDTANATLVVVNNGNGYARYMDYNQGSQINIANTNYFTLAEGEEMVFTFGTFMPGYFDGLVPDTAQRLLHLYIDGEDIDFNDPETPGITIYNHTEEGYSFYNYRYTQDTAKHRIEFVFGPYVDTTVCEPVSMPSVSNLTSESATVSWMPSPSAENYTVLFMGEPLVETTENSVTLTGLSPLTDYAVFIVAHCYNGVDDTLSYYFGTLGEPATMTVSTNGGYLYSYGWSELLGEGTYTFDGNEGLSNDFWAASFTLDYANQNANPALGTLEAIYVNGVSIALAEGTANLVVEDHLDDEGYIGYSYYAPYGVVDSIRFVFGPCEGYEEPCNPVTSYWFDGIDSTTATIYWEAPEGSMGIYYIVDANDAVIDTVVDNNTTIAYTFTGLTSATPYNYRISSKCNNGDEVISDVISFTTAGGTNTFSVTKNGNGYLAVTTYINLQNGINAQLLVGTDPATFTVSSNDAMVFWAATFDPNRLVEYFGSDPVASGYLSADALTVQSIYLDGQMIDLSSNHSGVNYSLEIIDNMVQYGYMMYIVTVNSGADHDLVFNYGEGETTCNPVTNYWVDDITSNTATLYWEAPAGNTGVYYIEYYGNVIDSVVSTDQYLSFDLWGLASGATYNNMFIQSKCANGSVVTSGEVIFTTLNGGQTYTEYNTFTVTKNGNGYLYYYRQSDEENGNMIQSSGTTSLSVGVGDAIVFEAATFDPSRLTENFGGYDPVASGYLSADALTVQSIYVDGQMIDLSSDHYGDNCSLQILDYMEEYGVRLYSVTISSYDVEDHEVVFNYGAGATTESYSVSFSSNDPTLGEVFSNKENGTYSEGTQLEAYALPQGGVTFVGWAKDSESNIISQTNPLSTTLDTNMNIIGVFTTADIVTVQVHDTLYLTSTDTVYLYNTDTVYVPQVITDTVYLIDTVYIGGTDTVYIYDTVYVGVDDVEPDAEVKLYSQNNQIVVEGAQGHDVVLYDAVGRRLAARRDDFGQVRFDVPSSGTYLVRVGRYPARRIVVVK